MGGELIYVCSPLEPESANPEKGAAEMADLADMTDLADLIDMAKFQCEEILYDGNIPVAPQLWVHLLRKAGFKIDDKTLYRFADRLIGGCDEVTVIGRRRTDIMDAEIRMGFGNNVPVRYYADPREIREEKEDRKWEQIIRQDLKREGLIWDVPKYDSDRDCYGDDPDDYDDYDDDDYGSGYGSDYGWYHGDSNDERDYDDYDDYDDDHDYDDDYDY